MTLQSVFRYICMYTHTHIHIYIHIYIHTHTYIHTYKHTHIHTYTHTHIHIHTGRNRGLRFAAAARQDKRSVSKSVDVSLCMLGDEGVAKVIFFFWIYH